LHGLKPKSDGTTAYEQPTIIPQWNKIIHCRFPIAFQLRVIVLLMMRLPSRKGNMLHKLPEPVFYHVIEHLAYLSYEEDLVPDWEIRKKIPMKPYKVPSKALSAEIAKFRLDMAKNPHSLSL